jgi:hypothetical protein
MTVNQADYEELLAEYSDHLGAIAWFTKKFGQVQAERSSIWSAVAVRSPNF